ncbi:MAG: nucleotide-binding protein [Desulfobacteraceae bacterium]|jgi:predicted nucleotide-binding protein
MEESLSKSMIDQLREYLETELGDSAAMKRWSMQVSTFLNVAISADEADKFLKLKDSNEYDEYALRVGHIQGLIAKSEATDMLRATNQSTPYLGTAETRKVFVVHGRDNEAKESTARFLEKLALNAIILHEQPNSGRTIIEKFEVYSGDVVFAVIILTPDDIGGLNEIPHELKQRARQNVILELGYFVGRLGRTNVCALHKGDIELPSDYQGVVYIEMDEMGAWKTKLAQELVQAKVPIDLNGLIGC